MKRNPLLTGLRQIPLAYRKISNRSQMAVTIDQRQSLATARGKLPSLK